MCIYLCWTRLIKLPHVHVTKQLWRRRNILLITISIFFKWKEASLRYQRDVLRRIRLDLLRTELSHMHTWPSHETFFMVFDVTNPFSWKSWLLAEAGLFLGCTQSCFLIFNCSKCPSLSISGEKDQSFIHFDLLSPARLTPIHLHVVPQSSFVSATCNLQQWALL